MLSIILYILTTNLFTNKLNEKNLFLSMYMVIPFRPVHMKQNIVITCWFSSLNRFRGKMLLSGAVWHSIGNYVVCWLDFFMMSCYEMHFHVSLFNISRYWLPILMNDLPMWQLLCRVQKFEFWSNKVIFYEYLTWRHYLSMMGASVAGRGHLTPSPPWFPPKILQFCISKL